MVTATQNDTSDLLILSDENTVTLEENPIIEKNTSSMDDLITFGEEIVPTEDPVMEVKEEAVLDMGFDLGTGAEDPVMEVKEEETALDMGFDLGASTEEPEVESKIEEINKVFSLEEATDTYVKQLDARKEQIAKNIESDESIISIKENKIKDLRSEITDYKNSIKGLNTEKDNIDTKIGLVSGKNAVNTIKSTTSTKVHNVKRQKAA